MRARNTANAARRRHRASPCAHCLRVRSQGGDATGECTQFARAMRRNKCWLYAIELPQTASIA